MTDLKILTDHRPLRNMGWTMLADFIALALGWLVFNIIRYTFLPKSFVFGLIPWLKTNPVLIGQLVIPVCMIALYAFTGCYRRRGAPTFSRLDVTLNTISVSFIGTLGIFFTMLINDNVPERLANYEILLILWLCLSLPVLAERLFLTIRRVSKLSTNLSKALIVNASPEQLVQIEKIIKYTPDLGYYIVGIHSDKPTTISSCAGLPIYVGNLEEICAAQGIDALMMPVKDMSVMQNKAVMDRLYRMEMPVFIAPSMHEFIAMRPNLKAVRPEPLIDIASPNVTPLTENVKRLFDIVFSTIALIILFPFFIVIAILIKLDSKGPVFYRQQRLGLRRKPFHIIKFRTMHANAENGGPALTQEHDPRITKIGRWLRKYRIDELPQFWNVLIGQMSIVGPRPEREYFAVKIIEREPSYTILQQVKPGITSWGMVKYGYASSVDSMIERMGYDMLYLRNVSLAIDLKILFYTIATVVTGRGL